MDMIAIVRIRGVRNIKPKIKHTLHLLGLNTPNHAVVLKDSSDLQGMLKIVNDYIAYGKISEETFKKLIQKRAYSGSKRLSSLGDKVIEDAVKSFIEKGERHYDRVFRLHPPRKGWKDIKRAYTSGGDLGHRPDMDALIRRMI